MFLYCSALGLPIEKKHNPNSKNTNEFLNLKVPVAVACYLMIGCSMQLLIH
jgi:hypothetical protein